MLTHCYEDILKLIFYSEGLLPLFFFFLLLCIIFHMNEIIFIFPAYVCIFSAFVFVVFLCSGSLWGRVEESFLWSSRQLGEHSPSVLLRSLVYLNTKYFGLRTVDQHMRLSFGNVYGPGTSKPHNHDTTVCICIPSISQDQHGMFHCSQITPVLDHKIPVLWWCVCYQWLICLLHFYISFKMFKVRQFSKQHCSFMYMEVNL